MPVMRIPDGGGDSYAVTPERLRDTAPAFYKASTNTADLELSLNNDAQQLIGDMASVLSQSPDALQTFFNRWREAMLSLSDSLQRIGDDLMLAADGYDLSNVTADNSFRPRHGAF